MADDRSNLEDAKELVENGDSESRLVSTGGFLSHDKLIGTIVAEKYRIVSILGSGGLGVVYKGMHLLLNRPVAIKVLLPTRQLDEKAMLRFQREAQAAIDLKHPNIASIQDFGIYQDLPFIVMEYVDGTPLSDIIDTYGALEPHRALQLLKQLCSGLGNAHKHRVIHRDIKPDNLMIRALADGSEELKIIDFGIAKIVEADARNLTQTGEVFGTPNYMSPEQCLGRKTDLRSDVYSVGCVAYEMFTGRPPFLAESPLEILLMHIHDDAPRLAYFKDVCPGIDAVVNRALAKSPTYRYDSAEQMTEDLDLIIQGQRPKDRGWIIDRRFIIKSSIGAFAFVLIGVVSSLFLVHPSPLETLFARPKDGSIESLTAKIKSNPSADTYTKRGKAYFDQEDYRKALADFTEAISLDPKNYQAHRFRSKTYSELRTFNNAFDDANKAVMLQPDDHRAYLDRAGTEIELEKYDDAIKDCEKSLSLNPKNEYGNRHFAYVTEAACYNLTGQFKEGKSAAEKAIALRKDSYAAHSARADANLGLKQYKEALNDADDALSINPKSAEALLNRAIARLRLNQLDKSQNDIDQALKIDPTYYKGYVVSAQIRSAKKEFAEALLDLNSALEIDSQGDYYLFMERARALVGVGRSKDAAKDVATALTMKPKDQEALELEKKLNSSIKGK